MLLSFAVFLLGGMFSFSAPVNLGVGYDEPEPTIPGHGKSPITGDSEMSVYTAVPLEFENISLSWFNQELTLDTGVDSCRICVSSAADCGESYYVVFPSSRQIHLLNVPCGCYVSVCKPGYIPYMQELAQVLYVQNQSFSDDASIASNKVVVGRNVTNAKAEGPVVVKNGELTIDATEGVVLQNDFKVNVGASLLINTGN